MSEGGWVGLPEEIKTQKVFGNELEFLECCVPYTTTSESTWYSPTLFSKASF